MEVTVGNYGRMMFEMMTSSEHPTTLPDHWLSIAAEARPLVEELIALNKKMLNGGYQITGLTQDGKKVLPEHERIQLAQEKLLSVKADTLNEGDHCWPVSDYDHGGWDQVDETEPGLIVGQTNKHLFVEMLGMNHEFIIKVPITDNVAKSFTNWEEAAGRDFWLKKADEFGI